MSGRIHKCKQVSKGYHCNRRSDLETWLLYIIHSSKHRVKKLSVVSIAENYPPHTQYTPSCYTHKLCCHKPQTTSKLFSLTSLNYEKEHFQTRKSSRQRHKCTWQDATGQSTCSSTTQFSKSSSSPDPVPRWTVESNIFIFLINASSSKLWNQNNIIFFVT